MNKPEQSANVIAYNEVKSQYERTMSAINTSYGKVNTYLGYRDNRDKQLGKIADNAEFLAEMLSYVIAAKALGHELTKMIEDGLENEALEYDTALWKYSEYQRALQNPVSLEQAAQAKAKKDALAKSESALARRRAESFWYWSTIDNFALVNELSRDDAEAQADAYIERTKLRYNMTTDSFKVAA